MQPPAANWSLVSSTPSKQGVEFIFANCDSNHLAAEVQQYFLANNYKLEAGVPIDAIYGRGSDVLRILFGAFAKRFKFNVFVEPNGPHVRLRVEKAMSGAMGGVIGHSAMKRETERIAKELQQRFTSGGGPVGPGGNPFADFPR